MPLKRVVFPKFWDKINFLQHADLPLPCRDSYGLVTTQRTSSPQRKVGAMQRITKEECEKGRGKLLVVSSSLDGLGELLKSHGSRPSGEAVYNYGIGENLCLLSREVKWVEALLDLDWSEKAHRGEPWASRWQ